MAGAHPRLIAPLDEIDRSDLAAAGGKAGNLGEMLRAGMPVPSGFCVTTEAYRLVAETVRPQAMAEPAQAREAMWAARIPDEIAEAIADAYRELGDNVRVAVRSSATAEDLPFASFAGQQDTFLNVMGEAIVLDCVRRCWASLWTDRAVAYRATNHIDNETVRLAVVVQRMVDASVAGVMFTAHPVTGHRQQTVIDASIGLGESVVSGAVNPDHFVVDNESRSIIERRVGDKKVARIIAPGGEMVRVERTDGWKEACLTDTQVLELVELGRRVQAYYGAPQDTEWAIDDSRKVWLTQARPITTLFPLPEARSPGTRIYFCFSVAQGLYRPITPMGIAAFRVMASSAARLFGFPVADPLAGPAVFAPAGQRIFIDATTAARSRVGRFLIPKVLGVMEARSAAIMKELFTDERFSVTIRSRLPFLLRVARVFLKYRVPVSFLRALIRPEAALRRLEHVDDVSRSPGEDRLDWVVRTLSTRVTPLVPRIVPVAGAGFAALGLASRLLGDRSTRDELMTVLRGVPHNVTTDMDLELWRLAKNGDDLAGFLDRYGHRAVGEIDIGLPRWSEDTRHLLGVLENYQRLDAQPTPDQLFAKGATDAEAMIETLAGRAGRRGRLVRALLHRARALAGVRELPKFHMVRVIAACRAELMAIGEELAAQDKLVSAEDIFFLDLSEAHGGTDMRETVVERRQSYEDELRRRHIPRVLLSDGTEPQPRADRSAGGLTGTPASAGVATGVARVILDPVGAQLEPGEILVVPSTDPGWTPLFLTAGALVMEMGGANSHGAVVAREYGIPAVVGVPDATSRIATGDNIVVDGTAGLVRKA